MPIRMPYRPNLAAAATSEVPSLAPGIDSISGVIDNFTKRRMELEREQREQRAQEARDAYDMRRANAKDQRDATLDRNERTKFAAQQLSAATRSPGGPMLWYDDEGNLHTVQPRFSKGAQRQAQDAPDAPAESAEQPPQGMQLREPELRVPGARPSTTMRLRPPDVQVGGPSASVTQAQMPKVQGSLFRQRPSTFFVDEVDDGEVQALPGPNEDRRVPMPQDSFPPGAREGQRFAAEDVGEDGRKGNPFASAMPMGPRSDAFVDRFEDGEGDGDIAKVLVGKDPRTIDVARSSLPPGAREGQRFRGEDVGVGPGRMNPDAKPIPPVERPSPARQPWPASGPLKLGGSSATQLSPTVARGAMYDMRDGQADPAEDAPTAEQGDRWIYDLPNGKQIVIDMAQQREARRAETESRIQSLHEAMQTAPSPQDKMFLAKEIAALRAQLPDRATRQMQQFAQQTGEREGRQGYQTESREDVQEFQGEQGNLNRANKKEVAAMRSRKGGGGSVPRVSVAGDGGNNPWAALDSKTRSREGVRLNREFRDWTTTSGWTKLLSTNVGRLEWAKANIDIQGPRAGAANAEAMMNIFGIARSGVPVKNETDEFRRATTTLTTHLDEFGKHIGLPQLGTRLKSGEFLSKEDRKKYEDGWSGMPEDQRQSIAIAIRSTEEELLKWGKGELDSLRIKLDSEPTANRYKATDQLNSFGAHIGLEPRQWWRDVPLRGGASQSNAGAPQAQPSQGKTVRSGSATPSSGGGSLDDLIRSLP